MSAVLLWAVVTFAICAWLWNPPRWAANLFLIATISHLVAMWFTWL